MSGKGYTKVPNSIIEMGLDAISLAIWVHVAKFPAGNKLRNSVLAKNIKISERTLSDRILKLRELGLIRKQYEHHPFHGEIRVLTAIYKESEDQDSTFRQG